MFPHWSVRTINVCSSNLLKGYAMLKKILLAMTLGSTLGIGQAAAASAVNLGLSVCEGVYSFSESGEISVACSGNLSIGNGTIVSDEKLTISAGGELFIDNLVIDAAEVWLYSDGDMTIGPNVTLVASTLANGGNEASLANIYISAGGSLTATFNGWENHLHPFPIGSGQINMSSVPLPGTNFLLLSALLFCSALRPARPQALHMLAC